MFNLFDEFFKLSATELVKFIPNDLHPMNDAKYALVSKLESTMHLINDLSNKVNHNIQYTFPLILRSDWRCKFYTRASHIRSTIRARLSTSYVMQIDSIRNSAMAIENSLQHIDQLLTSNVLYKYAFDEISKKNNIINAEWHELCTNAAIKFFGQPTFGYNVVEDILSNDDYVRYRIQQLNEYLANLHDEVFGKNKSFEGFVSAEFCKYKLDVDSLLVIFNAWHVDKYNETHPAYEWFIEHNSVHRDIDLKYILLDKNPYNTYIDSLMIYLNIVHPTPFMQAIIKQTLHESVSWNTIRVGILRLRRVDADTYSFA